MLRKISKSKKIVSLILSMAMLIGIITIAPVYANPNQTLVYDDYTVDYIVNSTWGDTQSINITVTNTGDETIENWMLAYDFNGSIQGIWNADVVQAVSGVEYVRNVGHNANILPNQSVNFGYTLTVATGTPDEMVMCQERVAKSSGFSAELNVINDWGPAFNGEIILTNTTDEPIEWWEFTFNSSFTITEIVTSWAAALTVHGNDRYTFKGTYTGIVAPNSSVALGFQATKNEIPVIFKELLTEVVFTEPVGDIPDYADPGTIENLMSDGLIEVIQDEYGNYRVIDGNFISLPVNSESDAARVLNVSSSLFGVSSHYFDSDNITVQSNDDNESFYRFNATVGDVPVLGSQIIIASDDNGLVSGMFSSFNKSANSVSVTNPIPPETAEDIALNDAGLSLTPETQLVVYATDADLAPALTWEVNVQSATYYIYANGTMAGQILTSVSNVDEWTTSSINAPDWHNVTRTLDVQTDAGNYRLRSNSRNLQTHNLTTATGSIVTGVVGTAPAAAAVSAHANLSAVQDFYRDVLGRNSFTGDGRLTISTVGTSGGAAYARSDATPHIRFGSIGSEAALDIAAHEYTHGVMHFLVGNGLQGGTRSLGTSNTQSQAYALNEGYADVLGGIIENKSDTGRWITGEDRMEGALRDMTQRRTFSQFGNGSAGAHTNGRIFSHAAYLMITDSRVSTISNNTWGRVFYNSLFRLGENATFLDARGAVVSSANALGFTGTQQEAIKDAFDAVEIVEPDSIRIVLTWEKNPWDLDAHLTGPNVSGNGRFHTWWNNMSYNPSSSPLLVADLDWDERYANTLDKATEITTIRTLTPGDYYFYVHDYSNLNSSSSTAMANSKAVVNIYRGNNSVSLRTIPVSVSSNGTLWNVCKLTINSSGGLDITTINTYGYNNSYGETVGQGVTLNTPLIGQEMSQWCWAASAQMAARTNWTSTRTQTEMVTHVKGSPVNEPATTSEMQTAANFASETTDYYVASVITESELITELNLGRPVAVLRGWYSSSGIRNGGHFTVIYGYQITNSGSYIFAIRDPWPVDVGVDRTMSYAQIVNGTPSDYDTGRWDNSMMRN